MPQALREADQTEKAYQKQDAVFLGRKRTLAKKSKKGLRYVRNVGLGFKTPKLALEGSYVDKKCPFTGNVSIRGRILKGMVISTKMTRTVVIRRDYLNWCGKYRLLPRLNRSFPRRRRGVASMASAPPASGPHRPFHAGRFEKRHKNMSVHVSPCFENVKEGDIVTVGQCRPLTKTVRFNVLTHEPSVNEALNVKKVFRVF